MRALLLTFALALLVAGSAVPARAAAPAPPASIAVILGQWSDEIQLAAGEVGVPWQIVAAVVVVESGGDPAMVAASGAVGLMGVRAELFPERAAAAGNLYDPLANLRAGAGILADLYARWGTWNQAIAGYSGRLDANGMTIDALDDDGRTGYEYVTVIQKQLASLGYAIAPVESAYGTLPGAPTALKIAMSAMNVPYVWGGESYEEGGFDCSGLVLWAYTQAGMALPRTAAEQWNAVTKIAANEVQPGDLIFFVNTYPVGPADGAGLDAGSGGLTSGETRIVTHVGFYAGNGQMLHAPKVGDVVRLTALDDPFWQAHLIGYGRVS